MSAKRIVLLPLAALLAGCATSKVHVYSDNAIRTCGKGNVAYVNAQDGRFGCKTDPSAAASREQG